jgi:copper transport protein
MLSTGTSSLLGQWKLPLFLFAGLALSALALLVLPSSVYAHANLVKSNPAPNSVLQKPPSQIVIWFTEPIEPSLSSIRVLDATGAEVEEGEPSFDPNDPTVMSVTMGAAPDGTYTVAWKNVSTVDGHRVRGSFLFSVGTPISDTGVEVPDEPLLQSPSEPVLRWLVLASVLAMVGGLAFDLIVVGPVLSGMQNQAAIRNLGDRLMSRSLKLTWTAILVFVGASVLQLLVQSALIHEVSVGVSLMEAAGPSVWSTLGETAWGELWLWRMFLTLVFAVAAVAMTIHSVRQSRPLAIAGAGTTLVRTGVRVLALAIGGGILWTLSLTSHGAATTGIRTAALVSDFVHLAAAAVWVGALFHLFLAIPPVVRGLSPRQRRDTLARLVPRFSLVAGLSVAVLLVTGTFNSWAQVTTPEALQTPYGQALILKVVLVGALLLFGALNLVWVRPGLARREGRERWLKRFVSAEVVLAILVLGSVGLLTSLEPARQVASRQGIGVPDAPLLRDTSEGTTMALKVEPSTVGTNRLTVQLEDRLGAPIANATDVRVRVKYLDADLGEDTASAVATGDGNYVLEGVPLSIAGVWQAELLVTRPDAFDSRAAFRFEVTASGASGSWAISPSPEKSNLLAGIGLAVLGVVFMVAGLPMGGWFTRAGAGVMVPGIVGLVVGVILLVNTPLAQSGPKLVNPFPPNPESLTAGETLYARTCQTCHGETGRGDGPLGVGLEPAPADLVVHVPLHPEADLFGYIHDGIPGTGMAPLGDVLTDDEIWHVINYIRTLEE